MESTINTAYKLITTQVDRNDIYYINPFDLNGFLINQINIDIRLDVWSGNTIIIYLPEIATLKGIYNFTVNVTAVYNSVVRDFGNSVVSGGNNSDEWNGGQIYNNQVMTWKPISMIDNEVGLYEVNPYYSNVFNMGRALNSESNQGSANVEDFKNLLASAKL